jgi:hypothetical protein
MRVFDTGNLVRVNPAGGAVTPFASGLPTFPHGTAIEPDNDILVASTDGVFRYEAATGADTPLTVDGPFFSPGAVAVTPSTPPLFADGDFTENRSVDAADFVAWKLQFGATTGAAHASGDANGDGDVDGGDFLVWQRQHGLGASTSSQSPASLSLPEPSCVDLSCPVCIAGAAAVRRRRGHRRPVSPPKLTSPQG